MEFGLLFPLVVTVCSGAALLISAREFVFESMERLDSRRRSTSDLIEKFRDRYLSDDEKCEFVLADSAFQKILEARADSFRNDGRRIESSNTYLLFIGGLGVVSAMGFFAGLMAF